MISNCDNCIFRGQWCEKENKCPLFKEDPDRKKNRRNEMDREKVIKAIDICLGHGKCDDCGYRIKGGYSTMDCRKPMLRDALALLKQEAVAVHDPGAYCPKCGLMLYPEDHPHHCGDCGQAVKWE